MERDYRGLRVVATVFKILAWISLILGIVAVVLLTISVFVPGFGVPQPNGPFANPFSPFNMLIPQLVMGLALPLLLGGGIIGAVVNSLIFYTIGEMIRLAIDIEENTRATGYLLRRQQ